MRLRTRLIIMQCIIVILTTIVFSYVNYISNHQAHISGINTRLHDATLFAKAMLPEDYHDKIVDQYSVSPERFDEIVEANNTLCVKLGMEYIWSLMLIDGRTVFTSSTGTSKDISKGDYARFFDVHSNPELYQSTFETMQPQTQINSDKWGDIHVALTPFMDSKGRKYLFGSSLKVTKVNAIAREVMYRSFLVGFVILLLSIIITIFTSRALAEPIVKIKEVAEDIASGNLVQTEVIKGGQEIESLSKSINLMSNTISEKITSQQQHARQLEESQDQLENSLKEKEVLIREVHHRVKNNMAIIAALNNMQMKMTDDDEARKMLSESNTRIRSMALVHEKLYQHDDLANVDVKSYFESLVAFIGESFGVDQNQIVLNVIIGVDSLSLDAIIPCGLIINELVSNAIKYAFIGKAEGRVDMGLKKVNGSIVLSVSDNGCGMPEGFDHENSNTLGYTLVDALVLQLEGKMELTNSGGTRCIITFTEAQK